MNFNARILFGEGSFLKCIQLGVGTMFTKNTDMDIFGTQYVHPNVVAVGQNGYVKLIQLEENSQQMLRNFHHPRGAVWCLDILEKLPLIIQCGDKEGNYHFFNLENHLSSSASRDRLSSRKSFGAIRGLTKIWCQDHTSAVSSTKGYVDIFNYNKNESVLRLENQGTLVGLEEDNLAQFLVTGDCDTSGIKVYDIRFKIQNCKISRTLCSGGITSIGVLPDQMKILVGGRTGTVSVFDIRRLKKALFTKQYHTDSVTDFERLSDTQIATCSSDYVKIWDFSEERLSEGWKKIFQVKICKDQSHYPRGGGRYYGYERNIQVFGLSLVHEDGRFEHQNNGRKSEEQLDLEHRLTLLTDFDNEVFELIFGSLFVELRGCSRDIVVPKIFLYTQIEKEI